MRMIERKRMFQHFKFESLLNCFVAKGPSTVDTYMKSIGRLQIQRSAIRTSNWVNMDKVKIGLVTSGWETTDEVTTDGMTNYWVIIDWEATDWETTGSAFQLGIRTTFFLVDHGMEHHIFGNHKLGLPIWDLDNFLWDHIFGRL